MRELARLLALLSLLSACGGGAGASRQGTNANGVVLIEGPEAASVWIDDRHVGDVGAAKGGFALSPGTYRLEVRLAGFHSFYRIIEIKEGARMVIEPQLARQLP